MTYIIISFFSTTLAASLAAYSWRHRGIPGGTAFSVTMLLCAVWTLSLAMVRLSPTLEHALFWDKALFTSSSILPVILLIFVVRYSRRDKWLTRARVGLLFLIPFLTQLMIWTNDKYHLFHKDLTFVRQGSLMIFVNWSPGPGYYIHTAYGYGLASLAIVWLFLEAVRQFPLYRRQSITILSSISVVVVPSAFQTFGLLPVQWPINSSAILLASGLLSWAIFHQRFMDIVPVARDKLIDVMDGGMIVLDSHARIVDMNRSALLAIGSKRDSVIGLPAREVFSAWPDIVETLLDSQQTQKEVSLSQDNAIRHYNAKISPLVNKQGKSTGCLILLHDISERKQTEDALRESERRYRLFAQNIEDVIWTSNLLFDCNYISPSIEKLTGYSVEKVLEMSLEDVLTPASFDNVMNLRQDILNTLNEHPHQNISGTTEIEYVCRDGSTVWSEVLVNVQFDENRNPVGFFNVSRNITDRKKAEDALRESEQRYRLLAENIDDVIWKSNLAFDWEYISPSTERLTGFTSEEAMKIPIQEKLTPASLEKAMALHQEALNDIKTNTSQNLTKRLEVEYHCKDGSTVWTEVDVKVEFDEQGNPKGFLGVTRNITDRKNADEEKAKLQSRLQQAQKMEAIGTLAGGVAHDLNNVLSGIVAYPELLLMKLPEDSPLRKQIRSMQNSGEKAATIVQDLLTLARRGVANYDPVNINAIVSEYLESPEHEKIKSFYPDVEFETHLTADLLNISGSSVHLAKTVMNLVSNAAEAITGKGRITVTSENRYISCPIRGYENAEQGDYVVLTVTDTGRGMSLEDKKRVFEPFYTKKKMGRSGTGLGMAVVWGTVKDHNGYIDLQSTIGKGATFTLYFPVTRQELLEERGSLNIEKYMGEGETILVIDDIEAQRELAVTMLSELGYSVSAVSSGEEAVEYLRDKTVDLLLLDMIMESSMDGFETYKSILEIHPEQKAIIASGFSETDRVKGTLELGAGQYVPKPYTLEKILMAVKVELDK